MTRRLDVAEILAARRQRGLVAIFDFDGTLVPIAPTPDAVRAKSDLRRRLGQLARRTDTLVGVVSGRPLRELGRFVGARGVWLAGLHGNERRRPGQAVERTWPPAAARTARLLARRLQRELRDVATVRIEHKGPGLAVHVRGLSRPLRRRVERIVRATRPRGFGLLAGRRVVELRPRTAPTKAHAIRWMSRHRPGAVVLFIGDDLTDEDGFAVLERGDYPVLVDDAAARRERPGTNRTRARFRLPSHRAVDRVIAALLDDRLWRAKASDSERW
ncbi:MAG: trehalose-phosphatase [Candidatus Binatia bacterium]